MKDYNQTEHGKKKSKKSMLITKIRKGKETRKNGWLKILRAFKSLLKSIGRPTNGKEAQKRTTERIAILIRQGYAGGNQSAKK